MNIARSFVRTEKELAVEKYNSRFKHRKIVVGERLCTSKSAYDII